MFCCRFSSVLPQFSCRKLFQVFHSITCFSVMFCSRFYSVLLILFSRRCFSLSIVLLLFLSCFAVVSCPFSLISCRKLFQFFHCIARLFFCSLSPLFPNFLVVNCFSFFIVLLVYFAVIFCQFSLTFLSQIVSVFP